MPNINASLGISQINRIEKFISQKRKLHKLYVNLFKNFEDIELLTENENCHSNYWLNCIILKKINLKTFNSIISKSIDMGFIVRPMWKPMHTLKFCRHFPRTLDNTMKAYKTSITLPVAQIYMKNLNKDTSSWWRRLYRNCNQKLFFEKNYSVDSLDRLIYQNKNSPLSNNSIKYKFIYGDILDLYKFKNLNKYGLIVFLAGLVGDPITKKYEELSYEINYLSIKKVIDHLSNNYTNKFFFISTCSNYGLIKNDELADENFHLNPLSSYAKAKVNIEKYLSTKIKKINFTIFRFATAFGVSPRMRFDLTLNQFVLDVMFKKKLEVYDAETWRPYCHVMDFARILEKIYSLRTMETNSQIINAGFLENHATKKDLIKKILKITNNKGDKINFKEISGSDPRNYRVDFKKLQNFISIKPIHNLDSGIEQISDFIKNNVFSEYKKCIKLGNYKI